MKVDNCFEVRTTPENPSKFSATFPPMEADLNKDTVDTYGLRGPLEDFALALLGQHDKVNGKKPVGIRFHSISFDFLLE